MIVARPADSRRDGGSAVVEFALTALLLVFLLFAVLQVAAYFYVRSVVSAAAADGARYGANSGLAPTAGAARASELISSGLSLELSRRVLCTAGLDSSAGAATVAVRCQGSVSSLLFPLGGLARLDVTAQSLQEAG
jgi:Flp pilus assembly protein TadG